MVLSPYDLAGSGTLNPKSVTKMTMKDTILDCPVVKPVLKQGP